MYNLDAYLYFIEIKNFIDRFKNKWYNDYKKILIEIR